MKICLSSLLIFSLAVSSFAVDIPVSASSTAGQQKLDAGKKRLEEQRKLEAEKKRLEEQRKLEAEKRRLEEEKRLEEQRKLEAEKRRLEEEKRLAEQRKLEAEKKQLEDARRQLAEKQRLEEEKRQLAEKKRIEDEKKRLAEQQKLEAEKKRLEAEKKRLAEQQRLDAEKKKIEEEKRQQAEKRRIEAEKKRLAEQQRLDAEKKHLEAEKQQLAAERQRVEAEKLRVEKEKKLIADQRAIRALVIAHRTAVLSADLEKMLSICSKSYSEISWNGKTRTYDDLLKMVKYYALVRTSDDLEVVMENALLIQGEVISDQLREKAASIKKTEQAKQTIDQIRATFDSLLAQSSRVSKFITVKSIVINGDTATAVSEIYDPESSKTYPAYYELILHRGKWLVKSVK